jgi:hypothetical protein
MIQDPEYSRDGDTLMLMCQCHCHAIQLTFISWQDREELVVSLWGILGCSDYGPVRPYWGSIRGRLRDAWLAFIGKGLIKHPDTYLTMEQSKELETLLRSLVRTPKNTDTILPTAYDEYVMSVSCCYYENTRLADISIDFWKKPGRGLFRRISDAWEAFWMGGGTIESGGVVILNPEDVNTLCEFLCEKQKQS